MYEKVRQLACEFHVAEHFAAVPSSEVKDDETLIKTYHDHTMATNLARWPVMLGPYTSDVVLPVLASIWSGIL